MPSHADKPKTGTVPYTMTLPDGRTVFVAIPEPMTRRGADGSLQIRPAGVRLLDQVRALAMKTPPTPTPAHIRTVREALGLTQERFAKQLGYSAITIKRWEAGKLKPGRDASQRIQQLIDQAAQQGVLLAG